MKTKFLLSFTAILAFFIIAVASSDDPKTSESKTDTEVAVKQNWKYGESVDKMTNAKKYNATCQSTNKIDFEFPYNGGSSFWLILSNEENVNYVILKVSKGQFKTSFGSSESCRIKFDNEEPMDLTYNSPKNGSLDYIFFDHSDAFIQKLKTSKKLMIESVFFRTGGKIIEFDTEGLKWDK